MPNKFEDITYRVHVVLAGVQGSIKEAQAAARDAAINAAGQYVQGSARAAVQYENGDVEIINSHVPSGFQRWRKANSERAQLKRMESGKWSKDNSERAQLNRMEHADWAKDNSERAQLKRMEAADRTSQLHDELFSVRAGNKKGLVGGIDDLVSRYDAIQGAKGTSLPRTPEYLAARAAAASARGILAAGGPDAELKARLEVARAEDDVAKLRTEVVKNERGIIDAKKALAKGEKTEAERFSERIARVVGTQAIITGLGHATFGALSGDAYQTGMGGSAVLGVAGGGGRAVSAWGGGQIVAGKGGPMAWGALIGGSVLSAITDGITQLAAQGGQLIQGANKRSSGYLSTYTRTTGEGPNVYERIGAAAMEKMSRAQSEVFSDLGPEWVDQEYAKRTGGYSFRSNQAAQIQVRRIQQGQYRRGVRAAYYGTSSDALLSGVAGGLGGRSAGYDNLGSAMDIAMVSGQSGKGLGALLGAMSGGAGGSFNYAASGLTRAFQGAGFTPEGVDAMVAQIAGLAQQGSAQGMSGSTTDLASLIMAQQSAGVAGNRMMNLPQGFNQAKSGARGVLTSGFKDLGKNALLVQALQQGGDIFGAMDAVENASPNDMMNALKGMGGGDFLATGYLRSQGLRGPEAAALLGGATGGIPSEVQATPEAGRVRDTPGLLVENNNLLYAQTQSELAAYASMNESLNDIKVSMAKLVRGFGWE